MSDSRSADELLPLFEKTCSGDQRARNQLFERLYDRLCRLTAANLRAFPVVRRRHDVESVVHDLCLKLFGAFAEGHVPANAREFFTFAAHRLRHLLIDEANKLRRRGPMASLGGGDNSGPRVVLDPESSSLSPVDRAQVGELHDKVSELPQPEQSVAELRLFLGFTYPEIGELLGLHHKKVERLWRNACQVLAPYLPEDPGGHE